MFGSNILEVALSIIFVYILLSLLCSTINEQVIVRILSLRANVLWEGIVNMLGDPALVEQFYDHPLIKALSQDSQYTQNTLATQFSAHPLVKTLSQRLQPAKAIEAQVTTPVPLAAPPTSTPAPAGRSVVHKPSYIPANIFALAFKDVLQQQRTCTGTINTTALAEIENNLKRLNIDLEKDLSGVEIWFNSTMDRVSGWYKRRVQIFIFLLGLLAAFSLNIDTIALITNVSHDTTVRATLVSAAQGYTQHSSDLGVLENNINQVQPLVGWYNVPDSFAGWLLKLIGLLTTTFAVALGAPFWFDVLNKFMSFRSSGPPPADTVTTQSADKKDTSTGTA